MSKMSKKPPLVSNYHHLQIHYPTKLGTVSSPREAGTGHTGIGAREWGEAYKMIAYIIYALPASDFNPGFYFQSEQYPVYPITILTYIFLYFSFRGNDDMTGALKNYLKLVLV